jgi:hypothetical protein
MSIRLRLLPDVFTRIDDGELSDTRDFSAPNRLFTAGKTEKTGI